MQSSSCSHGAEVHVAQYQRATWTGSINLFSSSISWEVSLSENKLQSLKHGLQLNLFNLCLSLYISFFFLCFSLPLYPFAPLFFPCHLLLLLSVLCSPLPSFSLRVSFLYSPHFFPPLWFVAGASISIWLGEPRASVSYYSSPGLLIKPCIVKDNPSETIRIF